MASVRFDSSQVRDWNSFHEHCKEIFGFPDFYGMNMDAWIDCLSDLNDDSGMSRFRLEPGEMLHVEILETERFRSRLPEVFEAFLDCAAFVNQSYIDEGSAPVLSIVFLN